MPCKSLNSEYTAKLYAKTEVTFTVIMAVFKFVNNKKTTKNSQLYFRSISVTHHKIRVHFTGD